jgi:hypothetical protein
MYPNHSIKNYSIKRTCALRTRSSSSAMRICARAPPPPLPAAARAFAALAASMAQRVGQRHSGAADTGLLGAPRRLHLRATAWRVR